MNKKNIKIGVLGGIGPEATGIFYLKLIRKLQKLKFIKNNTDYPNIIINSIPAPELIKYENITKKNLKIYKNGLIELSLLNPDFIIIVCNTIHIYYNYLQKNIPIPILNLKEFINNKLLNEKIKNITVFGTQNTIKEKLYKFDGFNYINPSEEDCIILNDIIFNFNKGYKKDIQIKKMVFLVEKYLAMGSQKIILGCTEFSAILNKIKLPVINTLDALVDLTIMEIEKRK